MHATPGKGRAKMNGEQSLHLDARRAHAREIAVLVSQTFGALSSARGVDAARLVIVRAVASAALGVPPPVGRAVSPESRTLATLRENVSNYLDSLPSGDRDLRGYLVAAVAECTLAPDRRRRLGAVYTDPALAEVTLSRGLAALGEPPARVLDPSCGGGAFLAAAALHGADAGVLLCGWDRDAAAIEAARARLALLARCAPLRFALDRVDALVAAPRERFDLVVGNPPYVRQETLGSMADKRAIAARMERLFPGAGAALGGKADLSVAFLLLGFGLLCPGGALAFVTTNAWLDTQYGAPLRRFLAERAEVRLVAEWEGRAFEGACVNPVIVVVRKPRRSRRSPARFVVVSGAPGSVKGISVPSARLRGEDRWGSTFLRRPDVLEEARRASPSAFAPLGEIADLHYGTKPGLVDFFVIDPSKTHIEPRFLLPVLTSTREIERIEVGPEHLRLRLFVCPLDAATLTSGRFPGAAAYVRRAARLRTRAKGRHTRAGTMYPDVPSVRANSPWYHLRPRPGGDFAIPLLVRERHFVAYTPGRPVATNMFYQGLFRDPALARAGTANLNATISLLAMESLGRLNIGGRINLYGPELRPLRVPDPRRMDRTARDAIALAFEPLRRRGVRRCAEEVLRSDRCALDLAVLEAAGVPSRFAPLLAEALAERVSRRLRRETDRAELPSGSTRPSSLAPLGPML